MLLEIRLPSVDFDMKVEITRRREWILLDFLARFDITLRSFIDGVKSDKLA